MEPNYYAIIPAEVRYNKKLTFLERFLYCEITALSNSYGYCFASNEYFAELYEKTPETISRAISNLKKENHVLLKYEMCGGKVKNRKIYPLTQKKADDIFVNGTVSTDDIFVNGELQKILVAIDKKVKDNIITYKDLFNIITHMEKRPTSKKSKPTQFTPPTLEQVQEYCKLRKNNVDAKRFFDYFEAGDWQDSQGKKVKNWKQKIISWEQGSNKKEVSETDEYRSL